MIRDYNKNDIDQIIKLFNLQNELSEEEEKEKREELEKGSKVLVYEDNSEIKGMCSLLFWNNPELGCSSEMTMSIEEGLEFNKIADALWEGIQVPLKEKQVVFLITEYNDKFKYMKRFYDEKEFEQWFGIHGMMYKGGKQKETNLTYRTYEESDFDIYYTNLGECFCPMRTANDIKPFNIFAGSSPERIEKLKKGMLEQKNDTYLFFDGDKFVGSSIIRPEIDDLFEVPEYQGQGYGRKIMEASLNLALEKNFDEITLGVVAWNKKAMNLYESLGFEVYRSFEHRRKFLKY